jgi:hypothetical protein
MHQLTRRSLPLGRHRFQEQCNKIRWARQVKMLEEAKLNHEGER